MPGGSTDAFLPKLYPLLSSNVLRVRMPHTDDTVMGCNVGLEYHHFDSTTSYLHVGIGTQEQKKV